MLKSRPIRGRSVRYLLPLLFFAAGCSLSLAQSPEIPRIRVDTTLVLVPVTVTDSSNRYVLGLDKSNFRVYEDDAEQKIKQFSGEDAPLSVGLIVDTSASIGSKLETARQAVAQFLKTMNAQDEAFLIEFNDKAEMAVPLTRDTARIVDKLAAAQSGGTTALFDALYLGLKEMKEARNPRKTLVVISDGGDNHSVFSAKEIMDFAREADVQIYALGVFEPTPSSLFLSTAELGGPRLLSNITEQTGGRAFPASSLDALPLIATRIGIELRNQYVLAYTPANATRDGAYRKLNVKLKEPDGITGLKARWRLGYYAPAE